MSGLAIWDLLNETERGRLNEALSETVPADAALRYREYLRRLSVDCPEFGVWLNLQAHAATRERLATGLTDLERLLAPLTLYVSGADAAQQAALARTYRAALGRPIVLTGSDADLALPSLGEGYVDHRFRLAFSSVPSKEGWEENQVRDDLPSALGAYLLSPASRMLPLLILGQPGSGKSVLTRILAARLPAEQFLPIRVELRRVDADADLQDHIESAILDQTGEHVQWTRFVAANPDLTPVVMLDGFDELLQATGVTQSDFLHRVERFQERELDLGRSVAVIVTTRTAVADRATIPAGTPIIRLEPFDDQQIQTWIDIWNRTNTASLAERGVAPLAATTITRYRTLAEQPLLLLMLALYDATDNALATVDPDLDQSAVYERLLREFARRELMKEPGIGDLDRHVELELLRLSIVAFAMFNRGAQWIDDASLTDDLRALRIWEADHDSRSPRSPLSTGQRMIGRFFFVHRSEATRNGQELQTYEFLHATFSEYLIARLVDRLLMELAQQYQASTQALSPFINDGLLYALLSFETLAVRTPIIEFIGALLARREPAVRDAMREALTGLFHASLDERSDRTYMGYQPKAMNIVQRAGLWNANLLTLMAFDPDGVSLRRLYPDHGDSAVNQWHRLCNLWRACVRGENLAECLSVSRIWLADGRDIVVTVGKTPTGQTKPDLSWSYHYYYDDAAVSWSDGSWWDGHLTERLQMNADFLWDRSLDLAMADSLPLGVLLPTLGHTVYRTQDGRLVTATALLTAALAAPYSDDPDAAVLDLAEALPRLSKFVAQSETELYIKLALGVMKTAVELDSISNDTRHKLRSSTALGQLFANPDADHFRLSASLRRHLATEPTPPTLATSPTPEPSPAASSPETPATPPAAP